MLVRGKTPVVESNVGTEAARKMPYCLTLIRQVVLYGNNIAAANHLHCGGHDSGRETKTCSQVYRQPGLVFQD
jgi:hypothetical protein